MPGIGSIWRKARAWALVYAFDAVAALASLGGVSKSSTSCHLRPNSPVRPPRRPLQLAAAKHLLMRCGGDEATPHDTDTLAAYTDHFYKAEDQFAGFSEVVDTFGRTALERKSDGDGDDENFQMIRIEKEPDTSSLRNIISISDVVEKIAEVRLDQSRYGCAGLYLRPWENKAARETVNGVAPRASFTVMQFNTLAEGLSSSPDDKPFNLDTAGGSCSKLLSIDAKVYGGFTSIPHRNVTLNFGLRKWRLLEVLLGTDGEAPFDIVGLQEVDRFRGFFGPVLKLFGYDGVLATKKKSPGVRTGWYSDGCALVWKTGVFGCVFVRNGDYSVGNQVFLIATLRHRTSGVNIVVAVTHLKAQRSALNEWTRCRQVEELLAAIDEEAKRAAANDGVHATPILILGDFNADPPSQVQFKESAVEHLLTRHRGAGRPVYHSAYNIHDPPEGLFTSWKTRGTSTTKRIIDYIFYAGETMQCVATLKVPPVEELEPTKLPGLRYPSDHLHIGAKFEIR